MPTVNIYHVNLSQQKDVSQELSLNSLVNELKRFVAEELTCGDIKLKPEEVSIRIINVDGEGMLSNIEVEIAAHSFKERVEKQDKICLNVAKFFQQKNVLFGKVKVWLILAELGHSWE